MRAASAASRIRRRALAAPRSTSLSPTTSPSSRPSDSHAARSRSSPALVPVRQRRQRPHPVVARVEERPRVEPPQPRLEPGRELGPRRRRRRPRRGAALDVQEQVRPARSQRASLAFASAASTEPAASASNMSLTMFSAVSRSISSAFFSPTAVWLATAPSSSASSSRELPVVGQTADAPRAARRGPPAAPPAARSRRRRATAPARPWRRPLRPRPLAAPHQVEHEAGARRGAGSAPGRRRGRSRPAPARRPRRRGGRSGRRRRAAARARRGRPRRRGPPAAVTPASAWLSWVSVVSACDPPAGLLVELGVLDRARRPATRCGRGS